MRTPVLLALALVALVAGGCADPVAVCRASAERRYAWECERCPESAGCAPGVRPPDPCEPGLTLEEATQIEAAESCYIECGDESFERGFSLCPPVDTEADGFDAYEACVDACIGR